jgi:hypothetical protein
MTPEESEREARAWICDHLRRLEALAAEGSWSVTLNREMAMLHAGHSALTTLRQLGLDTSVMPWAGESPLTGHRYGCPSAEWSCSRVSGPLSGDRRPECALTHAPMRPLPGAPGDDQEDEPQAVGQGIQAGRDPVLIRIPDTLLGDLEFHGTGQADSFRDVGDIALTITTVAANLVAILLARQQIAAFVRSVRAWMAHRTGPDVGSEFTLDVSARVNGEYRSIHLVSRRTIPGKPPDIDASSLQVIVSAVFDDSSVPGTDGER